MGAHCRRGLPAAAENPVPMSHLVPQGFAKPLYVLPSLPKQPPNRSNQQRIECPSARIFAGPYRDS